MFALRATNTLGSSPALFWDYCDDITELVTELIKVWWP
jgi:hypothetical protein